MILPVAVLAAVGAAAASEASGQELMRPNGSIGAVTAAPLGRTVVAGSATPAGVLVIGDSVTERIEQLPQAAFALEDRLQITVNAAVCRRLVAASCDYAGVSAPSALDVIRSLRRSPSVVVLNLGYNESAASFATGAAMIMTALKQRGVAHVVFLTLQGRSSYADTNRVIHALAARWPRMVQVIDWSTLSRGQPWFEQDGIHLNTDGAVALASAIRSGVLSACGKNCVLPERPLLQALLQTEAVCTEGAGGAWAAVLATAGSAGQALTVQRRATASGFGQSVIVQATPKTWEIVLFGFPTRAAAVNYYLQAKKRGFRLTIAPNIDNCDNQNGSWRAVFGQTTTTAAARSLLDRIRAAGFKDGSSIQTVVPGHYQVIIDGIQSTDQFTGFAQEALKAGFIVAFQPD